MRRIKGEHFVNKTGDDLKAGNYIAEQKWTDPFNHGEICEIRYIVQIIGAPPFLTVEKMLFLPGLSEPDGGCRNSDPFTEVILQPEVVTLTSRIATDAEEGRTL